MIYDKIDRWETYAGISKDVRVGLEYLSRINPEIETGAYEITSRVKAIVSEYSTKENNDSGYEAHREYVDIQYLISGLERILYLPLEHLKETRVYQECIDAAFYEGSNEKPQELVVGNGFFAIFYPQDGHMPGLCVNTSAPVKKVVVKVKL